MSWGPTQIRAAGLLGLLQLKDRGQNPSNLAEQVVPTIDMEGFWLRGERAQLTPHNGVIPGADTTWQIFSPPGWIVPAREWWWLEWMTCESIDASGNTPGSPYFRYMENYQFAAAPWFTSSPGISLGDSGTQQRIVLTIGQMWLPPNTELELVHCFDVAAVVGLAATITRAQV